MTGSPRTLTAWAVAVLWLDAALLVYAGMAWGRPLLAVGGAACALSSVAVLVAWRRHRRAVAEVAAARRELALELESMRALLRARSSPL